MSLNQRRSVIDYVLASNIASIDQGLREIRDTSSLVETVIQNDHRAARDILFHLSDIMEKPSLDILLSSFGWYYLSSASSPFFEISNNLKPLAEVLTPEMDAGGLVRIGGLSLLLSYEPLLDSQTGQVLGRIVGQLFSMATWQFWTQCMG